MLTSVVRQIVLDTETTGLEVEAGHRIIEIGCVELEDMYTTGKTFQCYIDPGREIDREAKKVHGLTEDFLSQFKTFDQIAEEFIDFIKQDTLIMHNAGFDMKFLQNELKLAGKTKLLNPFVDTLKLAKRKFPTRSVSLDALCKIYSIDTSKRIKHGALLDAYLLSQVYIELTEGSQISLFAKEEVTEIIQEGKDFVIQKMLIGVNQQEVNLHNQMISKIKNSLWQDHSRH